MNTYLLSSDYMCWSFYQFLAFSLNYTTWAKFLPSPYRNGDLQQQRIHPIASNN